MENKKNYALIFTYSFDPEVSVYPFETEEEAIEALEKSYTEELRIDIEENGWDSVGTIQPDKRYACIKTNFADRTDSTEMYVGNVHEWKNQS